MPVHRIILKTPDGTLDERMFSGNVVSIGRDERCVKERPNRKPNRLSNYDYSGDGAYFVTVCAKERMELFGRIIVGAASCRPQLSDLGEIVESEILQLSDACDGVSVDYHVVMPNHVHMIIGVCGGSGRQNGNGRQNAAPTVSRMIGQWKRAISIKAGFSPWQKSFHDHVIRNEADYSRIAEYIENNPANWEKDCFFGCANASTRNLDKDV